MVKWARIDHTHTQTNICTSKKAHFILHAFLWHIIFYKIYWFAPAIREGIVQVYKNLIFLFRKELREEKSTSTWILRLNDAFIWHYLKITLPHINISFLFQSEEVTKCKYLKRIQKYWLKFSKATHNLESKKGKK